MKILIAGGSGRVAAEVIQNLASKGHEVYGGSRHEEKIIKKDNVHPVHLDLHADVNELAELVKGMDAVYFLAGSRGKDLLQTDAFGAVKLMQACEKAGVRRYIQLSSICSLQPEKWKQEPSLAEIIDYDIAKFFADEWLIHKTSLDWTIIAPAVLKEEKGTGKVVFNPDQGGENPIPDVALVLTEVLERKNTFGKVINMKSGDTPVDEALKEI